MNVFKVHIENRYLSWKYFEDQTFNKVILDFNPIDKHLFSDDVFSINGDELNIIHSTTRNVKNIPCVLVLDKNKTYGRKGKKLLYKCIPDDVRLPIFLVSYDLKNIGFNKNYENKYITINFDNWNDKHPHGVISNVIGNVSELENFYTYQLYCKSLNASIQNFTKNTAKVLKVRTEDEYISNILKKYDTIENLIDKTNIFTIDPETSVDFDDAVSVEKISDNCYVLKIYISNVSIWMDVLDLWESFSERISTIYLPDRKRPMLPTSLSDCLCSLQQQQIRFAFMSEYIIEDFKIKSINYKNVAIRVNKNYSYESYDLLSNKDYHILFDLVSSLNENYNYNLTIQNSHDVIAYLMILMNYNVSKELIKSKNGIYRTVVLKDVDENIIPSNVPHETTKFLKIWNSSAGQYTTYSSDIKHELLKLDNYIHITSPIRRLVDLLNIIIFQKNNNMLTLSESAYKFLNNWIERLSYINTTMRAIRKIQCDCSILHMCMTNPKLMETTYDGYIFDRLDRNDGLYQYMVYLPELKLASRITLRECLDNYKKCKFNLYVFTNENKLKKKIRLNILYS